MQVFEARLTNNIRALDFHKILDPQNVRRIVEEADGYQPHLIAPEMGYRRLLQECLVLFKGPAEIAVDEVSLQSTLFPSHVDFTRSLQQCLEVFKGPAKPVVDGSSWAGAKPQHAEPGNASPSISLLILLSMTCAGLPTPVWTAYGADFLCPTS